MAHKKSWDFSDAPVVSREEARELGLKQFFTGKPCVQGHIAPRYTRRANCVQCMAEHALAWQKKMYFEEGDTYREYRRGLRQKTPVATLLRVVRHRAKKKGLECTITAADLTMPENCPCCGIVIEMRTGAVKCGPMANSPSIDRIDSLYGYVPGNVAIICWRCNELKRNASIDELRKIIAWMEQHETKRVRLSLVS